MALFPVRVPAPVAAASAVGMLGGLVYTLSPLTVWFGMGTAAVFVWAGRDVTGGERVWLFRILAAGFALRLLVLGAFFLATYPFPGPFPVFIPDEATIQHRAMWFRSLALGIPIAPADYAAAFGRYAESGHLYLLAYVQLLLGPAPYGIRLTGVLFHMLGAVVLYRTVRRSLGGPAALLGLALVVFLPSLFIWSVSALKEPAYLCLTAIGISGAIGAFRAETVSRRVAATAVCIAAVLLVGTMRVGAHVMVGGGILLGVLVAAGLRRPHLILLSVVLLTAIGWFAVRQPRVQDAMRNALRIVATSHTGHVNTPGWSYRLLDPGLYGRQEINEGRMTAAQIARYAIRAAVSVVLVPLPWQVRSLSAAAYLVEHVVWYILLLLAVVGVLAGVRADPRLVLVLCGIACVSAAAIALTSGNIGTLVRHRAMVLLPMAWLGSYGACVLLAQAAARQARPVSLPELTEA